jgi:hypothetical protein
LTLIGAWIAQLARDARIDTAMLATRHDLVAFLRQDEDARLRTGWRAELVGKNIERLVSGEAALAFEPSGNLILEQRSRNSIELDIAVPSADWTQPSEVGVVADLA